MVEATQPDALDLFISLAASVAIAVISEDEASCAAGDDGEPADAALEDKKRVSKCKHTPLATGAFLAVCIH